MANMALMSVSLDPDRDLRSETRVHGGSSLPLLQTVVALSGGERCTWIPRSDDGTLYVHRGRLLLEAEGLAWQGTAGDDLPEGSCAVVALEDTAVLVTTAALPGAERSMAQ